jgi:hypothetical protein
MSTLRPGELVLLLGIIVLGLAGYAAVDTFNEPVFHAGGYFGNYEGY